MSRLEVDILVSAEIVMADTQYAEMVLIYGERLQGFIQNASLAVDMQCMKL